MPFAVRNDTPDHDTVTFWVIDLEENGTFVAEVIKPGETSEGWSLRPGHAYRYVAVSWRAVAEHNASFGTDYDPTGLMHRGTPHFTASPVASKAVL
jgi:hypothetical protein